MCDRHDVYIGEYMDRHCPRCGVRTVVRQDEGGYWRECPNKCWNGKDEAEAVELEMEAGDE